MSNQSCVNNHLGMRAPLYHLTAGELGSYSAELERSLKDVLDKCSQWNAILLLDEADVFLEERNTRDLTRNAMVSGMILHMFLVVSALISYQYSFAYSNTTKESCS